METTKTTLNISEKISFVMYKIMGGEKVHEFEFNAISDQHAVLVANDFHEKCGLIGRYYCETSTGKTFSVS